jgi:uncharacterized protein with PIN domain
VQKQETVFFVDRCLGGKRLPESLRLLGIRVEIHDDHFAKDALDKDWLPQVASKKWIIFTKDIATAKAVRTHSAKHPQWHLVNNQTAPVFYGFDSSTKTSIAQSC